MVPVTVLPHRLELVASASPKTDRIAPTAIPMPQAMLHIKGADQREESREFQDFVGVSAKTAKF
ncbi:MAG: hypothetical protein ABT940_12935 [Alphaproteobacteria bacterium]